MHLDFYKFYFIFYLYSSVKMHSMVIYVREVNMTYD